MKWIIREHVKVDRAACPWVIKKFIDSEDEFYVVPAREVMAEAKNLGATPFDVPGVETRAPRQRYRKLHLWRLPCCCRVSGSFDL